MMKDTSRGKTQRGVIKATVTSSKALGLVFTGFNGPQELGSGGPIVICEVNFH